MNNEGRARPFQSSAGAALATARPNWPDLSAHPSSKLEWWFVQGCFELPDGRKREFMLSIFRKRAQAVSGDVHMALLSVLDPETGKTHIRSQVSPEFCTDFLSDGTDQMREWGADDLIAETFIEELRESGPPGPIRVEMAPVSLTSDPFCLRWGDLALRRTDDGLEMEFDLPEDVGLCAFELRSSTDWMTEEKAGGGNGIGTMAYHCCPRLALTGRAGAARAKGQAWMDHQWGGSEWFKGAEGAARLLGWEWFGMNLSGGPDLIIFTHRDMRSGDTLATWAIVMAEGQDPVTVHDISTTPARCWPSPETMFEYPVAWTIEIPSLSAVLEFTPTADNQEIPVYGFINAIWEGAGNVTGTFAGTPASGRARLELQGYGYIRNVREVLDRWVDRVDRNVAGFLPRTLDQSSLSRYLSRPRWRYDPRAHTQMLAEPAWDLMARRGKHWRSVFGLMLLEALGVEPAPYESALSVIPELVHTGSIIIDDIEDASELRRGEPTVHRKYGLETAINAANTLYFLPMLTLVEHPDLTHGQRDAIYSAFMEMFVQAHFGQAQDLYWSKLGGDDRAALWRDDALGDMILQAHALKTGAPVRAIADFACLIAGIVPDQRIACRAFAESLGVAFQIIDDVKNVSPEHDLGKHNGEDISASKFNYAVYRATRLLGPADRDRLLGILGDASLRSSPQGMNDAIDLIQASGALAECEGFAQELVARDWPSFGKVLPASRQKMMIRMMAAKLIGGKIGTAGAG